MEYCNEVRFCGKIISELKFSHEIYGEIFYEFLVEVPRAYGKADFIPVTSSERLIRQHDLKEGSTLRAVGQLRSYRKEIGGETVLVHTVFVREILEVEK